MADKTLTTLQTQIPFPASHAAAVAVDNSTIMLLGGDTVVDGTNVAIKSNNTQLFNIDSETWADGEVLDRPMAPCSATAVHDPRSNSTTVYALGGDGPPAHL